MALQYALTDRQHTGNIDAEVCSPRHGDHFGIVDGRVKGIHGERWRSVYYAVAWVQHAAHQQINQLISAAAHLRKWQGTLLKASRRANLSFLASLLQGHPRRSPPASTAQRQNNKDFRVIAVSLPRASERCKAYQVTMQRLAKHLVCNAAQLQRQHRE